MTLDQLRQNLSARGIVAMTLALRDARIQASGRREGGDGWLEGHGETVEAADEATLLETRHMHDLPKVRYFRRPQHGDLMVTYHGATPLASEGPFEEVGPTEYLASRTALETQAGPPASDDWGDW